MIHEKRIFTGGSSNRRLLRILPPLSVTKDELAHFADALEALLKVESA